MMLFGKGETIWWEWLFRVSEESFYRGSHLGFKGIAFASEGRRRDDNVLGGFILQPDAEVEACTHAYSFMASIRPPMVWRNM